VDINSKDLPRQGVEKKENTSADQTERASRTFELGRV
jgi:hypothetical protein